MFAVIFEVRPKKERWDEYLALAGQLKPKLEAIDGFVENERFASKREEGRLLSLSIWRDEKAVIRRRTPRAPGGRPGRRRCGPCATGGCASSATTACSSGGRHRSSIRRCNARCPRSARPAQVSPPGSIRLDPAMTMLGGYRS